MITAISITFCKSNEPLSILFPHNFLFSAAWFSETLQGIEFQHLKTDHIKAQATAGDAVLTSTALNHVLDTARKLDKEIPECSIETMKVSTNPLTVYTLFYLS